MLGLDPNSCFTDKSYSTSEWLHLYTWLQDLQGPLKAAKLLIISDTIRSVKIHLWLSFIDHILTNFSLLYVFSVPTDNFIFSTLKFLSKFFPALLGYSWKSICIYLAYKTQCWDKNTLCHDCSYQVCNSHHLPQWLWWFDYLRTHSLRKFSVWLSFSQSIISC